MQKFNFPQGFKFWQSEYFQARRVAYGLSLIVLVGLLLVWRQVDRSIDANFQARNHQWVSAQVDSYGASLAQAINRRLSLIHGLRAFVEVEDPQGTPLQGEEYRVYVSNLYESVQGIRNIALAPGGVMAFVYPYEENKSVLGYEPSKDERSNVRADVERTIASGEVVLSQPVQLIQGGLGIIARQAVFSQGSYWGLVNVVIDVEPMLQDAGILRAEDSLTIAIKDQTGQVFYGSPDVFAAGPVVFSVPLPEGSWQLAGIPPGGWTAGYEHLLLYYRVLGLFVLGLLTAVVYQVTKRQERLAYLVEQRTRALRESEAKYRQLVNNSLVGVYITQNHTLMFCNQGLVDIFGYPSVEDMLQMDTQRLVAPESWVKVEEEVRKREDGEQQASHYQFQALRADGAVIDVEVFGERIEYQGNPAVQGVMIDISDRVAALQALRASEQKYQDLYDSAPDMFASVDAGTGKVLECNKTLLDKLGYARDEVIGQPVFKLYSSESMIYAREVVFPEFQETGVIKDKQLQLRRKDGSTMDVTLSVTAVRDAQGEIVQSRSVMHDISEQVQAERLQQAIYQISQRADQVAELDELYPAIHAIIQTVMPAENFYLALYDEEHDLLSFPYCVDTFDDPPEPSPPGQSLTGYVLRHKQSLLCDRETFVELEEGGEVTLIGTLPEVWLGVPLMVEGKILGVVVVQHYSDPHAYGQRELQILEFVSNQIALAISRRLSQEATKAYARKTEMLYRAGQQISETLDLNSLYTLLYGFISDAMDCDALIVSSFEPDREQIQCEFLIHDGKQQDAQALPLIPLEPPGHGTQSRVIRSGASLRIDDYPAYVADVNKKYSIGPQGEVLDYDDTPADADATQSALLVPIKLEGKVRGVIQVMSYRRAAYSQEQLSLLEALAAQIAISANNVHLYQQAQDEIKRRKAAEKELQALNIELEERVQRRTDELEKRVGEVEMLNRGMANLLADLRDANALVSENARKLEQANNELEAFTYSVSHDLRAPLRHIDSFARLLRERTDTKLDETSQRYLNNIVTSIARMGQLIDDLLALSRTGRVEMRLTRLDLNQIIDEVRQELAPSYAGRQIVWQIPTLPTVWADPGLMRAVWANLLSNAIKYSRPRNPAHIEIGVLPTGGASQKSEPVFFVRDDGVGFDPQYVDKLFGVFQRLHRDDEFEGTGIGLSIVRRIIQRHGGKVWAEGELDRGATFYFSLPVIEGR